MSLSDLKLRDEKSLYYQLGWIKIKSAKCIDKVGKRDFGFALKRLYISWIGEEGCI